MSLPNDVARCLGLRDATVTLRPIGMCCECARWQEAGGERTPYIQPHAVVEMRDGQQVLTCSRRIAAKPLPIEG
jgi:hypothetical protein